LFYFLLKNLKSWIAKGTKKAPPHQDTQINIANIFSLPTYGITSCITAEANDPLPSINEDIVETADLFPFKYGC